MNRVLVFAFVLLAVGSAWLAMKSEPHDADERRLERAPDQMHPAVPESLGEGAPGLAPSPTVSISQFGSAPAPESQVDFSSSTSLAEADDFMRIPGSESVEPEMASVRNPEAMERLIPDAEAGRTVVDGSGSRSQLR